MTTIAEQLRQLGQRGILITAAEEEIITKLQCLMDDCLCPKGVGYFEKRPEPVSDWAPSVDHITSKSEGGQLTLDNIRLAHVLCNRVDYAKKHNVKHDKDLARAASGRFRDEGSHGHLLRRFGTSFRELSIEAQDSAQASINRPNEEFHRGRVEAYLEIAALMQDLAEALGLESEDVGLDDFDLTQSSAFRRTGR